MTDHEHDGMKFCNGCETWKPATAEYFYRDKARTDGLHSMCKGCKSDQATEYYQKNKGRLLEHTREYRQKNKDRIREYYQKNKEEIAERKREYRQTPVGRLSESIERLREKTGATIYLRDMTDEEKETLANQRIAVMTLEKTEKELLAASGKKRCSKCDRVLDYGCFNKNITTSDGVCARCRECLAEDCREYYQQNKDRAREYRQQNKDKINEYKREYHQQKKRKKALDKTKPIPDNGV